ncbi:MAG: hypothetical protein U0797_00800 [Gemmataceae bacterium]
MQPHPAGGEAGGHGGVLRQVAELHQHVLLDRLVPAGLAFQVGKSRSTTLRVWRAWVSHRLTARRPPPHPLRAAP